MRKFAFVVLLIFVLACGGDAPETPARPAAPEPAAAVDTAAAVVSERRESPRLQPEPAAPASTAVIPTASAQVRPVQEPTARPWAMPTPEPAAMPFLTVGPLPDPPASTPAVVIATPALPISLPTGTPPAPSVARGGVQSVSSESVQVMQISGRDSSQTLLSSGGTSLPNDENYDLTLALRFQLRQKT